MKYALSILFFIVLFCNVQTAFAQASRLKNAEGRWILLNTQTGSWIYEDDAPKPETIPIVAKNDSVPDTNAAIDIMRPAVTAPSSVPTESPIKTVAEGMHTIIVDGVEMTVPIQKTAASSPVVVAASPPPAVAQQIIRKDTSTAPIDTLKKVVSEQVGSEFATPEDEYRTKAASAGATTKQDDALTSARKNQKNKKETKSKKDEKVEETPKKAKKVKEAPSYCTLMTNEVDEFTGKEKKIGKPITLFTHTPEAARKFMRSDDYLNCSANFSRIGSFKTLHLTITVDSQFGQSEYGTIEDNSALIIKMIDGSTVELVCDKGDQGRVDKIKNQTIYNVFYIVESSFERQLNGGEASKVRLVWSVGFEDYELYDVDFFTRQIKCVQ